MTVFKGYMRIMKKNTGLILLYLCGISAILLLDSRRQTCYNK